MTVVVGGGGLIGSALVERLRADGVAARPLAGVPWGDGAGLAEVFDDLALALRVEVDAAPGPATWRVVWAAGRAVIPSPDPAHRDEVAAIDALLGALGRRLRGRAGDLVFVSSAGGVYAGSHGAPNDESTEPAPLSAYGRCKLEQERLVSEAAVRHGWQARIARVANVYGGGQDPIKPQGLVTRLCRAVLEDDPVRLFVPSSTTRHYVHVDDIATLLARLLTLPGAGSGQPVLRIVAAGAPVTVGELIEVVGSVAGRPVPVMWVEDVGIEQYGADISLRSHDEVMRLDTPISLAEGVAALLAAMRAEAGEST